MPAGGPRRAGEDPANCVATAAAGLRSEANPASLLRRMKICLFGLAGIPLGKHNVKDARLDQVHQLVEAKKRTYAQVDVAGEEDAVTADAIVVSESSRLDAILRDLEFVETRLERSPPEPEKAALEKIKAALEREQLAAAAGLAPAEAQAVAAHVLLTLKPVVVATAADLERFDEFLVRVLAESGYCCYLTVGGPENRAWLIKQGMTAPDTAGVIHTDIQKGFIRAEVISFADLVAAGGETQAKRANKLRLETKQYVVQDYDVVNFRFTK
jgi:ribosome-binding ATPase YchF (GTP1/OBG family)